MNWRALRAPLPRAEGHGLPCAVELLHCGLATLKGGDPVRVYLGNVVLTGSNGGSFRSVRSLSR
jgi:hypothetical protein